MKVNHSDGHQPKSLAPQQELYEKQEQSTLGSLDSLDFSLPMNNPGGLASTNNTPLVSSDFTQDWEAWIDLDDTTGMFTPGEEPWHEETGYISHLEPSLLRHDQQQVTTNSTIENPTPNASTVSQEAKADTIQDQLRSRRESSVDLSKSEKVRSHDMANEGGTDSLDDVTRQLTSRLGRLQIAEDGQPRYFGATSNLHILHSGPQSLCQPNIRNVYTHGDAAIAQAGLQWQEDSSYEDNLIKLFFSWHNALMYVVDEEIFLRERKRYKVGQTSDLYSPALANAVYVVHMKNSKTTELTHIAMAVIQSELPM